MPLQGDVGVNTDVGHVLAGVAMAETTEMKARIWNFILIMNYCEGWVVRGTV